MGLTVTSSWTYSYADTRINMKNTVVMIYTNTSSNRKNLRSISFPCGIAGNGVVYNSNSRVVGNGVGVDWYLVTDIGNSNSTYVGNSVGYSETSDGNKPNYAEMEYHTFTFDNLELEPGQSINIRMPFNSGLPYTIFVCDRFNVTYQEEDVYQYTITYNANGGYECPVDQIKYGGETLTLSDDIPTKTYSLHFNTNGGNSIDHKVISLPFKYWNTNSDGTGTIYYPGSTYSERANLKLYAIWGNSSFGYLPIPYKSFKISFNPVQGQISPTYKSVDCTFIGWYDSVSEGQQVSQDTIMYQNTIIYAHWSDAVAGDLPVPYRSSCKFIGWYNEYLYLTEFTSSTIVTSNITIYAKWRYKIILDGNEGTIFNGEESVDTVELWKDHSQPIILPNYQVTYTEDNDGAVIDDEDILGSNGVQSREFKYWSTNSDGTGNIFLPGEQFNIDNAITLYAHYEIKTHTVSFLDGFSEDPIISSFVIKHGQSVSDSDVPIPGKYPFVDSHLRNGYSFVTWSNSWTNVTNDMNIIALWNYSPIWIRHNSVWIPYEPEDKEY